MPSFKILILAEFKLIICICIDRTNSVINGIIEFDFIENIS